MKTKLLLLFALVTAAGFSQMPIPSYYNTIDHVQTYTVLSSVLPLEQGNTGANQTWDVTGRLGLGTVTDQPALPTATETNEFPGTTYTVRTFGAVNNVPTDGIIFSTENAGVIAVTGLTIDGLKLNYSTDNASVGTYPLNYGYTNTDAIAGTFNYTTYSGTFTGTLTTAVDAYGLVLQDTYLNQQPSIAVTRLKTLQNINLFYPPFGNVGTITITSYSYFSNYTANYPVLRSATTAMVVPLLSINQTRTRMELIETYNLATPEIQKNTLTLYPNPTENTITIQGTNEIILSVKITDTNGRLVAQSDGSEKTISIGHLQNGMYFATIMTDSGSVTKKIIKK